MKHWVWILAFAWAVGVRAEVAIGTYVPGVTRYQIDKGGSTNKFEFAPLLSINRYFRFSNNLYFAPELGVAWHLKTESEYYKYTAFLLYGFGWHLATSWVLRFGAATFYTLVGGSGEAVSRDNGSGAATFYTPATAHTSFNLAESLGLEYYLNRQGSLRAETYIFDLPSAARRSFSYALSYNYHF